MLVVSILSRLAHCINGDMRRWWIRCPSRQQQHQTYASTRTWWTHSLPSTRYWAWLNNVQLQREIFFSASTTEETTVESTTPDIVDCWLVKQLRWQELDEIQWGMFPFWPEAYVSLGLVTLQSPPHWLGSTAIMTTITFVTACMMIHPIQHQHIIFLPSLHYSCVLLFYDHTIMILMILMTHAFSYPSLTLPGLSLDLHSFNYSFLLRLCPFLLSLPHSLCNHSILLMMCYLRNYPLSWPL